MNIIKNIFLKAKLILEKLLSQNFFETVSNMSNI